MDEVGKYGMVIPVAEPLLSEIPSVNAMLERLARATPEERAQWKREATERRAAERDRLRVELTDADDVLRRIGEHFGWSPTYVRHLAQPYCECDYDTDGAWNMCSHANDEGFH